MTTPWTGYPTLAADHHRALLAAIAATPTRRRGGLRTVRIRWPHRQTRA